MTSIFGYYLIKIERFGLTSVPELSAKPIIDIFVFIYDIDYVESYLPALESCCYSAGDERNLTGYKLETPIAI